MGDALASSKKGKDRKWRKLLKKRTIFSKLQHY